MSKMLNITLSDSDVLFMDDTTGNIDVSKESCPDCFIGDSVRVHFIEDAPSVSHDYTVTGIDGNSVTLAWKNQLTEDTLTEANPFKALKDKLKPSLSKEISKQVKKSNKAKAKFDAKAMKLCARDLGPDGKFWKFWLQREDGTWEKPIDQAAMLKKYQNVKNLDAAWANAIVQTDDGFIVRRGLEDLNGEGIKLTKSTAKIRTGYSVPWPAKEDPFDGSAEDEEDAFDGSADDEESDTNPSDETTDSSDTETADDTTDSEESSEEAAEEESSEEASTETKSDDKPAEDDDVYKSGNKGVSKKVIAKFKQIAYAAGLNLLDAFDKPVDTSSIAAMGKITPETLPDYRIKVKGNELPLVDWLSKMMKAKVITESCDAEAIAKDRRLLESPFVTLTDKDLMDPASVSLADKRRDAITAERDAAMNAAKNAKERELQEKNQAVVDELAKFIDDRASAEETLDMLFDKLVPGSGEAETLAGEIVRAMMRILYRDANDGDKFFEGYGLETCASSAAFLYDNGLEEEIQKILDDAIFLAEDDDKYTVALDRLTQHVIDMLSENSNLFWTPNTEDSRDYPYDYIEENQPTYEFEITASPDVCELVDNGIINAWDLNRYVDNYLGDWYSLREANVERPWSSDSCTVVVSNLTRDGYDQLHDIFERDTTHFWDDLISEYADDLGDGGYDDDFDMDVDD